MAELLPELKYYYEDGDGDRFPMLRHPLIYAVPYFEGNEEMYNDQYLAKKEYVDRLYEECEYHSYIYSHERPYRLLAFNKICDFLEDRQYWELMSSVWSDSENIWAYQKCWEELIISGDRTEESYFMDEMERDFYKKLPDSFEIFRGFNGMGSEFGLSWTLNRSKAEWFARRFNSEGAMLASTLIEKKETFAYLSGRNEDEIIIYPNMCLVIKIEEI